MRVAALEIRFYPDGKKLRGEVALVDFAEVNVPVGDWSVLAKIEISIEKSLGSIGVRINNDGRLMNRPGRVGLFSSLLGVGAGYAYD
jgi:hypothetical protein